MMANSPILSSCHLLALDLGAESGRGILGTLGDGKITFEVLHRFPNGPTRLAQRLYWDPLRLFGEMKQALARALERGPLASLGIDTWGVDFALLGEDGELLGNPRHYRDPHTEPILENILHPKDRRWHTSHGTAPAPFIFEQTGLQFLRFNTLFQLLALRQAGSSLCPAARHLLFMPDLFHYWFGGRPVNEASIASTSQCLNPTTGTWAWPLLEHFQLPRTWFGEIVPAGTRLGEVQGTILAELNSSQTIPILAPASHDTAAAVAAVPAQGENWCYLSSGTWSLMGVELPTPIIHPAVHACNFTNEGGVQGTTRFLKNIMGMWLVQECRRSFQRNKHERSYEELVQQARQATPFQSVIQPDDSRFLLPDDMPTAITRYCQETGQPAPASEGALIRCCLESLALRYRWTREKLTELTGKRIDVIHIVGGGCQNQLLNQLTANATGCTVLAGPVEATALGNLLTQAMGLGLVRNLEELRTIVRNSFTLERFEPEHTEHWDEPYARFLRLLNTPGA